MIVDDQRTTRMLVRSSLREIGYKLDAVECSNGEEALQKLAAIQVRLIISDSQMPKLDGLGLLCAIRARPELKAVPFIMLTGVGEVAAVKQAIEAGVNGYVVKPFTLASLRKSVEAAIGPPRP